MIPLEAPPGGGVSDDFEVPTFGMHLGQNESGAGDLDGVSAHSDIRDLVAGLGCGNKDLTRTVALDALFDLDTFVAGGDSVLRHPRGAAAGGRAGGRIFAVIEDHASV
jgi:hypothetical protein